MLIDYLNLKRVSYIMNRVRKYLNRQDYARMVMLQQATCMLDDDDLFNSIKPLDLFGLMFGGTPVGTPFTHEFKMFNMSPEDFEELNNIIKEEDEDAE